MVSIDIRAFCALAAAMILWSGSFVAMKVVLTEYHPFAMVFSRMVASICLLLPFVPRWRTAVPFKKGDLRVIAVLVISEPCLYFIFEGFAMRYTTASQAGMVIGVLPLTVGVCAHFFLKERLSTAAWLGFFLAVGGVAMLSITGNSTESAPNPLLGNSLEFMAVIMATSYTVCVRRLAGYPALSIVAMQSVTGIVFFGALLVFSGVSFPRSVSFWPTLALAFLSAVTIIAYGLYNFGIGRLSAGQAAAWTNLIPVVTLIMGFFLLGETLTGFRCVALIPVLAGIALSQISK